MFVFIIYFFFYSARFVQTLFLKWNIFVQATVINPCACVYEPKSIQYEMKNVCLTWFRISRVEIRLNKRQAKVTKLWFPASKDVI